MASCDAQRGHFPVYYFFLEGISRDIWKYANLQFSLQDFRRLIYKEEARE